MSHADAVRAIYEAFGRGDVPGILAHLAPDVEWEYGGSPNGASWLRPRRGHAGARAFFEALAKETEVRHFMVKEVLEHGELVLGVIDIEFIVRATGRRVVEEDEIHVWRFNGDTVARFRHRADTALAAWAATP